MKIPTFPSLLPVRRIMGALESQKALLSFSALFPTWLKREWESNEIWRKGYKSSINWFEKLNVSLLSNCLIWCCTSIELRIKDDPNGTSLFVGGSWKMDQWGNFHWNSNLWLPSLQSQKFWQDTLAGQAKNPLAREQFTDGCGSSETWIVIK